MLPLLIHPPGYAVGSLALVADSFHMLKYVSSILLPGNL
jgi:Co/Zn/Cd efflux system component